MLVQATTYFGPPTVRVTKADMAQFRTHVSLHSSEFLSHTSVVGGLVVLTQTIFVQGLRILGQKMNDPFGDDMIDLSVIHFVVFNWRMSNRVLRAEYPKFAASLQEEEELSEDWIGLGEAWDKNEEEKVEDGNNAEGSVSDDPTNLLIRGESDVWRDTE